MVGKSTPLPPRPRPSQLFLPSRPSPLRRLSPSGSPSKATTTPQKPALTRLAATLLEPVPGDPEASKFVGALCAVGALQTLSGILVTSLFGVYLREDLGLSLGRIGQLESLSLLVQKLANFGSGVAGDLWSHRRLLLLGSILFALARPMFAATGLVHAAWGAAGVLWWVSLARLVDKATKGLRDTPTKALIARRAGANRAAALASKAAYQNLAVALGGVVASATFVASGQSYEACFAAAVVPAAAAAFIAGRLPEEERADARGAGDAGNVTAAPSATPAGAHPSPGCFVRLAKWFDTLRAFPPAYWQGVVCFAVLFFARFEGSFVNIRVAQASEKWENWEGDEEGSRRSPGAVTQARPSSSLLSPRPPRSVCPGPSSPLSYLSTWESSSSRPS